MLRKTSYNLEIVPKVCANCGKELSHIQRISWFEQKKYTNRKRAFCSIKCYFALNRGPNHKDWKGGRFKTPSGYIHIYAGNNKHRDEHVLIAEKHLGRKLSKEMAVHHIDGNKSNNKKGNLLICTKSYNAWLHGKMSQLYAKEHFGGG